MIRELATVSPMFFKEDNQLFSYKNNTTKSNILMELAKSAKDDALREVLVNRQTYRQREIFFMVKHSFIKIFQWNKKKRDPQSAAGSEH